MKYPPTRFSSEMMQAIGEAVVDCASESDWQIAAAAVEPTHMHLLLTYTERDVDRTAKWLAQQTTKAVHKRTSFEGPVWCEGRWLEFVFDPSHFNNIRGYIEQHNLRRGLPEQPWLKATRIGLEYSSHSR